MTYQSKVWLHAYDAVKCRPSGTGQALADWLRGRGLQPQFVEMPRPD
jgi:NAD+ diphosphatase